MHTSRTEWKTLERVRSFSSGFVLVGVLNYRVDTYIRLGSQTAFQSESD